MQFEKGNQVRKGKPNPNAGRKTDKDIAELQRVMDTAISYEERVEIFRVAAARARAGDSAYTKIVLGYLYGTPVQRVQDENGGMVIQVVRVPYKNVGVEDAPPGAGEDKK